MFTSESRNRKVTFLGQNSHGSDESWQMRLAYINGLTQNAPVAVLVECPTIDLILFTLKRRSLDDTTMATFLASSTYWWMRSTEFRTLLMDLPQHVDIFGIDTPLTTTQHRNCIPMLNTLQSHAGRVLSKLLIYDMHSGNMLASVTAEERERSMADKLSIILEEDYSEIIVICHNFHATRYSWLPYHSLCQRIIARHQNMVSVKSYGVFSQNMAFIATPDGKTLSSFQISNACSHCGQHYQVKMVSSYYRSEQQDVLSINIHVPLHYDEVIVYPSGHPITVERSHG